MFYQYSNMGICQSRYSSQITEDLSWLNCCWVCIHLIMFAEEMINFKLMLTTLSLHGSPTVFFFFTLPV